MHRMISNSVAMRKQFSTNFSIGLSSQVKLNLVTKKIVIEWSSENIMSKHDIPTYYDAEWSWVIYVRNQIIRTAEKFFLVYERYQNEHRAHTDSDGLKNDKH